MFELEIVLRHVTRAIEFAGIVAIVGGIAWATLRLIGPAARRQPDIYRAYRSRVGRAILLGLEFLVAADIINTVAIDPTLQSVGVLAGIVAIRTFLSLSLEVEIDGRWPWQRGQEPAPAPASASPRTTKGKTRPDRSGRV